MNKTKNEYVGKWMIAGLTIGVLVGFIIDKGALGTSLGLAIGAVIGGFKWKQELKKNQDL